MNHFDVQLGDSVVHGCKQCYARSSNDTDKGKRQVGNMAVN